MESSLEELKVAGFSRDGNSKIDHGIKIVMNNLVQFFSNLTAKGYINHIISILKFPFVIYLFLPRNSSIHFTIHIQRFRWLASQLNESQEQIFILNRSY